MNDTAIKNYAVWARRELVEAVGRRCALYAVSEGADPSLDSVGGRVLSSQERRQRKDLLDMVGRDGFEQLVERAAYTWFNRLLAIRFMELNDRLPSHVRVLSAPDGNFRPQALSEAMDLPLEALDRGRAAELVQSGDDEALFRLVFLAQCDELAGCMPAVFERVGSAMELLLPDGLLREGGVVEQLVTSIPEEDWREGVEIVGWMYQYYVTDAKERINNTNGKIPSNDIAPVTQWFTPSWVVKYLIDNSVGRLWISNKRDSCIHSKLSYFEKCSDDDSAILQEFTSPEDLTIIDPACGSGHILVYAFDVLSWIYQESGYSNRDAAKLILTKNLTGIEIDPRAVSMSSFVLMMKACELDSRFLKRGISPRIYCPTKLTLHEEEQSLLPHICLCSDLLKRLLHFDEFGSLVVFTDDDIQAISEDIAMLRDSNDLFASAILSSLEQISEAAVALSQIYSIAVANPPYLGYRKLNSDYYSWLKTSYPDSCSDLYAAFINRGFTLSRADGLVSMVTMHTWATDKSFYELRHSLLAKHGISSMMHMGSLVMPIAFETSATIFFGTCKHVPASIFTRTTTQNITNGVLPIENFCEMQRWTREASFFEVMPENIIAYWMPESAKEAVINFSQLKEVLAPRVGIQTGDTERFLRYWWEVDNCSIKLPSSVNQSSKWDKKWYFYKSGGGFRKWYGNAEFVINWENDGEECIDNAPIEGRKIMTLPAQAKLKAFVSWSDYGLGKISFRYSPNGYFFDVLEPAFINYSGVDENKLKLIEGFGNSSVADSFVKVLMPGRHKNVGKVAQLPFSVPDSKSNSVIHLVDDCLIDSRADWNSFEESCDFERHPLV